MNDEVQLPDYLRDSGPPKVSYGIPLFYESAEPDYFLRKGYSGDAGFDLIATEDTTIDARDYGMIPSGIRLEIPAGMFAWIVARSSTMQRWGLIVLPGIIDTGFRGELMAAVWNTQGAPVKVKKGDRVAQFVLLPNLAEQIYPARVFQVKTNTDRGSAGFGSTGAADPGVDS